MADIRQSKHYDIDSALMKTRLEQLAEEMHKKFGINFKWDGDTCQLSGSALKSGHVSMTDSAVTVELTLGFMAKMLKGQIEKEIETRLDKLVQPEVS